MPNRKRRLAAVLVLIFVSIVVVLLWMGFGYLRNPRGRAILQWWRGDIQTRAELVTAQREACPGAPFILPADGYIGLLYGDDRGPYSRANPHQGIDIFSPDRATPGLVPVYAASDGYITRESDWRSTLIQRVPQDPFQPQRQIWLYYTHMAEENGNDFIEDAFPPGTSELFVKQGTLLGYTGNYNGESLRGIWVHLHFSIVLDDGSGKYRNELEFGNTLDPSPYLGMPVSAACAPPVPACDAAPSCAGSS